MATTEKANKAAPTGRARTRGGLRTLVATGLVTAIAATLFLGVDPGSALDPAADTSAGSISATCPADDEYENNDTMATATPLTIRTTINAIRCPGDDDWYRLTLGQYQTVDILTPSNGPLDVVVRNSNNGFVATSTTDLIQFSTLAQADYFILVSSAASTGVEYTLSLDPGFNDCFDTYEPNNSRAAAMTIFEATSISAVACDDDYYRFNATAGSTVTGSLDGSYASGDLDLRLLNSAGTVIDFSSGSGNIEEVSAQIPSTGTYYLWVDRFGFADNPYDLTLRSSGGPARCAGQVVTVDIGAGQTPTAGDDVILGTAGPDVINADNGDDVVCAGGGNDTVIGGNGNDLILGQDGNDILSGNGGNDGLAGGEGRDQVFGGSGQDSVFGSVGDDLAIGGGSGRDNVYGDAGDDVISGGSDDDFYVAGGTGDDAVNGGGGNDPNVHGQFGNDTVSGNGGQDNVLGGPGNDEVRGGPANDLVYGGLGNDFVAGNNGSDRCDGGPGADTASGNCETTLNVP
jgi:Ca2+-binding RTX toxin-like protein